MPREISPVKRELSGRARKDAGGRVLVARLGINPNSSGHGVLWAALFFLPPSLVSVLLAAVVEGPLDRALHQHRLEKEREAAPRPLAQAVTVAIWGLTWAGVALSWSMLLLMVASSLGMPPLMYWFCALLTAAVALPLAFLAHRCRHHEGLRRASLQAAGAALAGPVLVTLIYLIWQRPPFDPPLLYLAVAAHMYVAPLAILLTLAALRAAGILQGRYRGAIAAAVYLVLGLIFIFPFPPLDPGSYNTVGVFFPVWGLGVPAALSAWALGRLGRCGDEDPEDPV